VVGELSPEILKKDLKTTVIGREILYYSTLPSTMDTARDKARSGAPEGTVIIAGEQTAGRGRLKRSWISPVGNVALSIILRPDTTGLRFLIMIASLAAAHAINAVTGQKAQIKWPNDVLINGKKVCGILIENEFMGSKIAFTIIGIGINTDLKVTDHTEISESAASLKAPRDTDMRIAVIKSLLTEFDQLYAQFPDGASIYHDWRANLVTLGKKVKATWGQDIIEGMAEDVDEDGALWIREADGKLTRVVAGDVTLKE
jgi:BirA family transcriptional regulator, biotin operon repressor / biotin---[acetyl-CoA-carboxylase] ligase